MAPTLGQRSSSHRPHLTDLSRADRYNMRGGAPAPAKPDPRFPAEIQAAVHVGRPRPALHEFPKL
eukprot:10148580-Alexandrium_andersonii.AAC.1